MFKENYKACFDNIKGDSALLEKILKQADSAKDKRIKFSKIYKYTASVAAAVVVVTSSVYLFNSGILKADIPEVLTEEQTKAVEKQNDAYKEGKNETPAVIQNEVQNEVKTQKEVKNNDTPKNSSDDKAYIPPHTDTLPKESQNQTIINPAVEQTAVPEISSVAEPTEEIAVATAKDSTEQDENFAISRTMPNSADEPESVIAEAIAETESFGFEDTIKLSLFKEGILDAPEYEYISSEKTIIAYHDKEHTKRIELTIYKEETEIVPEGEIIDENSEIYKNSSTLSAVSKGSDYQVLINADNISEEYMKEIIQSF